MQPGFGEAVLKLYKARGTVNLGRATSRGLVSLAQRLSPLQESHDPRLLVPVFDLLDRPEAVIEADGVAME